MQMSNESFENVAKLKYLKITEKQKLYIYILAVPGMRCNASRKPPFRWTLHEVR
jgi:hypothetical protein